MNKIELLSPAGNYDALVAAIHAGANAVYLSGKSFGARSYADNFSNEELIKAVEYAHLNLVKVYVTINTLVFDDEFALLNEFLRFLVEIKIDAVIVQDLGVIKFIKINYPSLNIHASTQLNIFNALGAINLMKMGVKRVVVARETSFEDLKAIINTGIEVEVFCHGALCFSSSGNCLASSVIGRRSGNRGKCAQPCRKNYSLMEDKKIISANKSFLSTKDLMTINHLAELINIGVCSLKIEGRMKSQDYVYVVTKHYAEMIRQQHKISDTELDELLVTFNRNFTDGYLFEKNYCNLTNLDSVNHQGVIIGKIINRSSKWIEIKLEKELSINDGLRVVSHCELGLLISCMYINGQIVKQAFPHQIVRINVNNNVVKGDLVLKTSSQQLHKKVLEGLTKQNQKLGLSLTINIYQNTMLTLTCVWDDDKKITVTGEQLHAGDHQLSNERIRAQLSKFANTIYYLADLTINSDGKTFLSVSSLNAIRRTLIVKLNEYLLNPPSDKILNYTLNNQNNYFLKTNDIECVCQNDEQVKVCEELGITNIYSFDTSYSGRIISNSKTMIHNLGQLNNNQKVLSPYFNLTNSNALSVVADYGISKCYLSLEIDLKHLKQLQLKQLNLDIGICCYGKIDMMVSKHCIVGKHYNASNKNCGACLQHKYHLIDEFGHQYPLLLEKNNECSMRIINYQTLNLMNYLTDFKKIGINKFLLIFTNETPDEIRTIISQFRLGLKGKKINQKLYTGFIEKPVI